MTKDLVPQSAVEALHRLDESGSQKDVNALVKEMDKMTFQELRDFRKVVEDTQIADSITNPALPLLYLNEAGTAAVNQDGLIGQSAQFSLYMATQEQMRRGKDNNIATSGTEIYHREFSSSIETTDTKFNNRTHEPKSTQNISPIWDGFKIVEK